MKNEGSSQNDVEEVNLSESRMSGQRKAAKSVWYKHFRFIDDMHVQLEKMNN